MEISLCVYVFVVLRLCTHIRLGILATGIFVYNCVVLEGIYTCKAWSFSTRICLYVYVVLYDMYICKTGHFGNDPLCLCVCFSVGCVPGYLLVSVVGLLLGCYEGSEPGYWDGKLLYE